ncbi:MAG: hypothetical protein IBJ00_02515 [Alphaproteobacteria bacterium]|nr:hypothetical protein [Alphaproteobacteria bacterium]
MESPSFIATLKQAHRFTIQNFWVFLPLALKTALFFLIICMGFLASFTSIFIGGGFFNTSGDILNLLNRSLILVSVWIILFVGGIGLTVCPFYVSLFRRALLNEEIDRKYLRRMFATRELNFFIAHLKMMSAFVGVIFLAGILGLVLYGLTVFLKSVAVNTIAIIGGGIEVIVLVGLLCFLYARFSFVSLNVALDRGSNLKTSIRQTKHNTLFLLGIPIFVNLSSAIFQSVLQAAVRLFMPWTVDSLITPVVFILISITLSYYVILLVPAAISYVYKEVVLKVGDKERAIEHQQAIPPL